MIEGNYSEDGVIGAIIFLFFEGFIEAIDIGFEDVGWLWEGVGGFVFEFWMSK